MAQGGQSGQLAARVNIDIKQAEAALKTVQALSQLAEKSLADLAAAAREGAAMTGTGLDESTAAMGRHKEQTDEGTDSYRKFFREQRLQDRILRETKEALVGTAFAMQYLLQSTGGASEGVKKFERATMGFLMGMQAGEFAAFSLGRSLEGMGGTLGKVGGAMTRFAGGIGAVVGIGAGLIQMFQTTKVEIDATALALERATKALAEWNKETSRRITENVRDYSAKRLQSELEVRMRNLDAIEQELDALDKKLDRDTTVAEIEKQMEDAATKRFQARGKGDMQEAARQRERHRLLEIEKNKYLAITEEDLKRFEKRKKFLVEQQALEAGVLDTVNNERKVRQRAAELNAGTINDLKDIKDLEQAVADLTHMREVSAGKEREHFGALLDLANKRLKKMQETPSERAEEQRKREEEADEHRLERMDKFAAARKQLSEIQNKAELAAINNEFERRKKAEEDLHAVNIANIGLTAAAGVSEAERKRASNAEDTRHAIETKRIEVDKWKALEDLRVGGIVNAREAEDANFDVQRQHVQRMLDEKLVTEQEAALMTKKILADQSKVRQKRAEEDFDAMLEGVDKIGSALQRAFDKGGDSFLSKMVAALQVVMGIVSSLNALGKEGGGGIGGILGVVGSVLGLGGLFSRTAIATSGAAASVAGVQGVERASRTTRQASDGGGTNPVMSELRALNRALSNMNFEPQIVIEGAMDGQTFMRKNAPKYERFRSAQRIG